MANKIILKKTSTASKVPLATDLEVGEIAVNLADQKLYSKNASGTVILVGDGQGTGDVVGPSSAVNNNFTSFNGTTGKLVKDSGYNSASFATAAQGALADTAVQAITSTDGSVTITGAGTTKDLSVAVAGSTTNVLCLVRNTTGSTLTKGTVVYISGATGQNPTVSKAIATGDSTSAQTLGMMTADLANNSNGYVTIIGLISNIDTSAYTDGAQLYLSGTTAGAVTATKPSAPIHLVYVAVVEYAHPTQGKLFVKVQNGYELNEIHDVAISSPTTGQTIVYNSATQLWNNSTVSLTNGVNGLLPVANGGTGTATPALVAGTNITVTGTWPNQTITSTASGLPSQTGNAGKYLTTDGTIASWQTVSSATQSYTRTTFTATAGQTTFTVSYNPACFQVYLNGVFLTGSDYTATSGTSFVLSTPAALNDIVEAIAYSIVSVGQVAASGVLGGSSGQVLTSNGTNGVWQPAPASLPSQTGNSGKYLTTNGTDPSWSTVDSLPSQSGNTGKYLTTNGTTASWATVVTGGGPITQNADQVTSNQTIASGSNGFSVGPMTIASGYTVTVASGQRWVII